MKTAKVTAPWAGSNRRETAVNRNHNLYMKEYLLKTWLLTGRSGCSLVTLGSQLGVLLFSHFTALQTFCLRIGRSYINIYTCLYKYGL